MFPYDTISHVILCLLPPKYRQIGQLFFYHLKLLGFILMAYNMRLQSTMSGMVLDILSPTLRDKNGWSGEVVQHESR